MSCLQQALKRLGRFCLPVLGSLMLSACAFHPVDYFINLISWSPAVVLPVPEYRPRLELARSAFSKGHYGITIAHLEAELAERPTSIAALNGIGASYDSMGRHSVAQQYYFIALGHEPDSAITLANIGYSYLLQERNSDAVALFELALRYDGEPKDLLYRIYVKYLPLRQPSI